MMHRRNNLFIFLLSIPLLVCCQTVPTNGLARFYLNTPSSLTPRTNFTVLYHLMRKSQKWPDPKNEDLKEQSLLRILGNYVSSHLSTKIPKDFDNIQRENEVTEKELLKTMPQSLKTIKFDLPEMPRRHARSQALTSLLQLLLWRRSYCPVEYKWMDLGKYVWPRYMKVGYCPKKSCSIPVGMTCQPSKQDEKVRLLLWFCSRSRKCSWKIYSESITTECKCQCQR